MRNRFLPFAFIVLIVAAVASPVSAGHRCNDRCNCADVDIEKLKADVRWYPNAWNFCVKYKVEIEDYRGSNGFDLVLEFADCGRPVVDGKGRPIQYIIPLDRPSKVDDDEIKFKGSQQFDLPGPAIGNPKKLKIRGVVVRVEDGRPMDSKRKSVKFRD